MATQGQNTEADSSALVHSLAVQQLQEEEAARRSAMRSKAQAARAKKEDATGKIVIAGDDGKPRLVVPMATFSQMPSFDFTEIPAEFIKSTEPYGKWQVRWVRKRDMYGEADSDTDINLHKAFGFEVIQGKGGDPNKPFETKNLIAMQGPKEGLAALLARFSIPGSAIYDQAHGELDEMVRTTNKKAGRRVVDTYTSEDHGHEDPRHVSF